MNTKFITQSFTQSMVKVNLKSPHDFSQLSENYSNFLSAKFALKCNEKLILLNKQNVKKHKHILFWCSFGNSHMVNEFNRS